MFKSENSILVCGVDHKFPEIHLTWAKAFDVSIIAFVAKKWYETKPCCKICLCMKYCIVE